MVDIGDADIVHTDMEKSHANTEFAVRKILDAGALPLVLGGDHSVHAPVMQAYEGRSPIHIVQIDAHLDFVDERHGVRYGHGNPMRRSSEQSHVTGLTSSASGTSRHRTAKTTMMRAMQVRPYCQCVMSGGSEHKEFSPRFQTTSTTIFPLISTGSTPLSHLAREHHHGGFLYYEVLN